MAEQGSFYIFNSLSSVFSHKIHFSKYVLTYFVQSMLYASLHGGSMQTLEPGCLGLNLGSTTSSSVTKVNFLDLSHLATGSNKSTFFIECYMRLYELIHT